mgnify:CR=1 FL=1
MRFEKTKDILEHARHFHKLVSECYQQLSAGTEKQRLKLLLDYLAQHEKHLEEVLADYEETIPQNVLRTWFRLSPCQEKFDILKSLLKEQNPSIDEVIRNAVQLDDCLIDMYRKVAESAEVESVREVFKSLLDLEEHEKFKMVRDSLRLQDL